ncbi:MAG: putative O-glycosylation ligase, exosortase A system-associated [Bacteroidota bacterium]
MRDIVIGLAIFGSVPFCLIRPDIGMLVYIWIGLMNPHRLSWRLQAIPVGVVIAAATLIGTVIRGEIRRIPMSALSVLLIVWTLYTTVTTIGALSPLAWVEWNRFSRIMFMCFVALMLLQERKRLERYVWVAMASIAFYGVKGGLFSILTRGQYRVWGPMGSFIEGNNELALAELMVLPLMLYFMRRASKSWQRLAYVGAVLLTVFSIIFSYSRGALVALAGVASILMLRSRYRFQAFVIVVALGGIMVAFAPQQWKDRMYTLQHYEGDQSAMQRLNSWGFAYNIAKTHLFGAGFRTFTRDMFIQYAPDQSAEMYTYRGSVLVHDSHSIYFEAMAEQGFPGLAIFLAILIGALWKLERLRRSSSRIPSQRWVRDLSEMLQFSLLGYMLGGAFLGLAYFDLPYYMIVSAILLEYIAEREAKTAARPAAMPSRAAAWPGGPEPVPTA